MNRATQPTDPKVKLKRTRVTEPNPTGEGAGERRRPRQPPEGAQVGPLPVAADALRPALRSGHGPGASIRRQRMKTKTKQTNKAKTKHGTPPHPSPIVLLRQTK